MKNWTQNAIERDIALFTTQCLTYEPNHEAEIKITPQEIKLFVDMFIRSLDYPQIQIYDANNIKRVTYKGDIVEINEAILDYYDAHNVSDLIYKLMTDILNNPHMRLNVIYIIKHLVGNSSFVTLKYIKIC